MSEYAKVFVSILGSSLWEEAPAVRIVFLTLTLLRDLDDEVRGTPESLSRAANIPLKSTKRAIKLLEAPDPRSKSQEEEGRRIVPIPGGWRVVNGAYYRNLLSDEDRKAKNRDRVARWRAKRGNAHVTPCNAGNDRRGEERRGEERKGEGGSAPEPPAPPRFPLHCPDHQDTEFPPKCGQCKERRETHEATMREVSTPKAREEYRCNECGTRLRAREEECVRCRVMNEPRGPQDQATMEPPATTGREERP